MVKLTLQVITRPHKEKEFKQTLESLMLEFRKKKGCLKAQFEQNRDDPDNVHITSEWETMNDFNRHLQGHYFTVLLGTIKVLCETPKVQIDTGAESLGMDYINDVREQY
jgi:quinol monooxygenase YgiN